VEALMWAAGDVWGCGMAGVGTVDWMVEELRHCGSQTVAELQQVAARRSSGGGGSSAVALQDVRTLLPALCTRYEQLVKQTKNARTARLLESRKADITDIPAAQLLSVSATATTAPAAAGTAAGGAAAAPGGGGGGVSTSTSGDERENAVNMSVDVGVESRADFIAFADERTRQMSSREELFAYTKARQTTLLGTASVGWGRGRGKSGGELFVDWLMHGAAASTGYTDDTRTGTGADDDIGDDHDDDDDDDDGGDEEDYDELDGGDNASEQRTSDIAAVAAAADTTSTTTSAAAAAAAAAQTVARPSIDDTVSTGSISAGARPVLAHMLRERLFGIVSLANRNRNPNPNPNPNANANANTSARSASAGNNGEGGKGGSHHPHPPPPRQLAELSCALTVTELCEARAQLYDDLRVG
jgi:hypothetical protein